MLHTIDFNSYDHNFCESTIYSNNQHPEYLNSLSSLFITFIGINALFRPHIHFLLRMLYSSLAVNGITSCLYHYNNNIGWGLLDRMSMILIAFSSISLFLTNLDPFLTIYKCKRRILINRIINLLLIIYFTSLFTVAGLHMETLFNIMFGLFLSTLILFMYLINKHYYKLEIPYKLVILGWKGCGYIIISGLFWIITETLCHQYFIIKFMLGHVWWHLFVSYGGYLISLLPTYLFLQNYQIKNMLPIMIEYDKFNIPYLTFYKTNNLHSTRV